MMNVNVEKFLHGLPVEKVLAARRTTYSPAYI